MNTHKVAILDLGTNTFNLLLVKITPSAYFIFQNEKIAVKIGKEGINQGVITTEAQGRALDALAVYKKIIDREKITKVYAFATSAFRNAKNGEQFKELIKRNTGYQVNIISGDTEAKYIYEGVKTAFDIGGDPVLIMDVGGGSVEFVICDRDRIFWKQSLDIGAQRLLDWHHKIDPLPIEEIEELNNFFTTKLDTLKEQIEIYKPYCLVGSSGTFDTLSEMYQHNINRFLKGDEIELPLTVEGFETAYQQVISLDKQSRLKIPGMHEMRVDMIVVVSCLVKFVIDTYKFKQIRVSAHSLKEGIIHSIQEEIASGKYISASGI
jgi:exopolyphosphatase/guanosine-5'-triphosphate,3'-diphosphate pyrophosphatase